MIENLPISLFNQFNNVKFHDDVHKYFVGDKQLISVTTLIHKYQQEFNHQYWSGYKADEYHLDQQEIERAWTFLNKKATMKGSIAHNYAENLWNNKFFPYPKELVMKTFGYDPIYDEFLKTKKLIDIFFKKSYGVLIPIKTEYVICDVQYGIGGMIDLLVYNVKQKEFQLWDYKTNKKLNSENKMGERLKGSLFPLQDCEMEIYSLQLGLYKKIIEKNTGIKIGRCYLVWISHFNEEPLYYEIIDRSKYVDIMVNEYVGENQLLKTA